MKNARASTLSKLIEVMDATEIPTSRFGTASPIRESAEWQAIVEAIGSGCLKKGKVLKVKLPADLLMSMGMKRPAFNFQQYLRRYLTEGEIPFGDILTRKIEGEHYLFVTAPDKS